MKQFEINFEYSLTAQITIHLSATVKLHHSDPYYIISDFHLQNHTAEYPLLPDIKIKAIKDIDSISWVHIDSLQESVLSMAVGKAIENKGDIEIIS